MEASTKIIISKTLIIINDPYFKAPPMYTYPMYSKKTKVQAI